MVTYFLLSQANEKLGIDHLHVSLTIHVFSHYRNMELFIDSQSMNDSIYFIGSVIFTVLKMLARIFVEIKQSSFPN